MAVGTSNMLESNMMEGENFYIHMETATEPDSAMQSQWTDVKNDTGQLCRVCGNSVGDDGVPIYEGQGREHQLEFKIQKHLPIQVSITDVLPLQLCYQCASTLIVYDGMVSNCLEVEKKLKAIHEAAEEVSRTVEEYDDSHLDTAPDADSDDEPLIQSKTKLLSEKSKATPIKKKILSKAKTRSVTIKTDKTATDSKEGEDKERFQPSESSTKNEIWTPLTCVQVLLDNQRVTCRICLKRFVKAFDLADHLSRDHDSRNVYHCQFCDKIYETDRTKFVNHIRSHLPKGGPGVQCFVCNEVFKCKSHFRRHFSKEHSKEEFHKCETCDETFDKLSDFNKHNLSVHKEKKTEEKYYTCHLCGKQFSHSTGLSYHLKHVHEGIKEHGCDICGRKFALKAAREDHRRIHTGERPFVCHTCGKTFKAKASLYIHSKTHTDSFPHPCTYCERRFRWRQQLLGHITTHTGEKKHFCETCGKGFGVKNDLTRHKLVHSQEKPFLCLLCGLSFGQKRYLKNHEKSRHKGEKAVNEG